MAKFAVDTRFVRLAAALALDRYPAVPSPITVETIFDWVTGKSPLMREALRFVVYTIPAWSCWVLTAIV